MPRIVGVDHLTLTVTDLPASHRFYTDVLGFVPILDFGAGRMYLHNPSALVLGLVQHEDRRGGSFSELNTGLDHVGLAAADLPDLRAWEQRFRELGIRYTPIREVEFGYHLNFRDPDGIALELSVGKDFYAAALAQVRSGALSDAQIQEFARQLTARFLPSGG